MSLEANNTKKGSVRQSNKRDEAFREPMPKTNVGSTSPPAQKSPSRDFCMNEVFR